MVRFTPIFFRHGVVRPGVEGVEVPTPILRQGTTSVGDDPPSEQ